VAGIEPQIPELDLVGLNIQAIENPLMIDMY